MIINKINSYSIILKASKYQGLEQFDKVVELPLKALEVNPKSQAAFRMLADDYPRLGKYKEAIKVNTKALNIHPKDWQIHYLMAVAMFKNEEPIDKIIPYLKNYSNYRPKKKGKFPFFGKLFAKFIGLEIDWDEYARELDEDEESRYQWAKNVIEKHEKANQSPERTIH